MKLAIQIKIAAKEEAKNLIAEAEVLKRQAAEKLSEAHQILRDAQEKEAAVSLALELIEKREEFFEKEKEKYRAMQDDGCNNTHDEKALLLEDETPVLSRLVEEELPDARQDNQRLEDESRKVNTALISKKASLESERMHTSLVAKQLTLRLIAEFHELQDFVHTQLQAARTAKPNTEGSFRANDRTLNIPGLSLKNCDKIRSPPQLSSPSRDLRMPPLKLPASGACGIGDGGAREVLRACSAVSMASEAVSETSSCKSVLTTSRDCSHSKTGELE